MTRVHYCIFLFGSRAAGTANARSDYDIGIDKGSPADEFTYELAWKAIKVYLEEMGVAVYSPRDAMRAAFQNGLINDDPLWLQMINAYGEPLAEHSSNILLRGCTFSGGSFDIRW